MANDKQQHIVHNHLENNFYLGNKKALFYNMREYARLRKKNPFENMPLTFHIRKGFKDPEYARFVSYYEKRDKIVRKHARD